MGNSPTKTKQPPPAGSGQGKRPPPPPPQQQQQYGNDGGARRPSPGRSLSPGRTRAVPDTDDPTRLSPRGEAPPQPSEDMFTFSREQTDVDMASPVEMAPPSNAPVPHPELASMPNALAAAPTAPQASNPQPVRLTYEAITATAFDWQRPPIGKGGFSTVYEGSFYNQSVAVKLLTIRNQTERDMFEEELRALLNPRLFHRFICPLLAFCHEKPAFVFPKLSPLSLERLRRLPLDVRDAVCIDVARGLAHMHAAGYVHSDMKPDNVLIEFDQNRVIRRGVVGDMGCVKSCLVPVKPFGTIVFLDPSLNTDIPRLPHPADDVYSLGVTFLSIFMTFIPATRDDIARMTYDFNQRDPLRAGLIRMMMHPDPSHRPSCARIANMMKHKQEELYAQAQQAPTAAPVFSAAMPPPPPSGGPPPMSTRDRVIRYYQHYCPAKVNEVDAVLAHFRGRENDMWGNLFNKYGPEPPFIAQPAGGPPPRPAYQQPAPQQQQQQPYQQPAPQGYQQQQPHPTAYNQAPPPQHPVAAQPVNAYQQPGAPQQHQQQPQQQLRQRIAWMVQHYDPTAGPERVQALLQKHNGQEQQLLSALVKKYGPEPGSQAAAKSLSTV